MKNIEKHHIIINCSIIVALYNIKTKLYIPMFSRQQGCLFCSIAGLHLAVVIGQVVHNQFLSLCYIARVVCLSAIPWSSILTKEGIIGSTYNSLVKHNEPRIVGSITPWSSILTKELWDLNSLVKHTDQGVIGSIIPWSSILTKEL